jgi:hypothetical protein
MSFPVIKVSKEEMSQLRDPICPACKRKLRRKGPELFKELRGLLRQRGLFYSKKDKGAPKLKAGELLCFRTWREPNGDYCAENYVAVPINEGAH